MISMLFSGRISDLIGRKKLLLIIALLYAVSAILSALAISYDENIELTLKNWVSDAGDAGIS